MSYFPAKRILKNIIFQFVEIKCAEHDLTLQTVNRELETTASSFRKNSYEYLVSPRVQYKHKQNHVETLSRDPCKQRLSRCSLLSGQKCPLAEPTC